MRRLYTRWPPAVAACAVICASALSLSAQDVQQTPPASAPSPITVGRPPIIALVDDYAHGNWLAARAPLLSSGAIANVQSQLSGNADEWVQLDGREHEAKRRLSLGAFVLEFLETQDDGLKWQDGQVASNLLEWTCAYVRNGQPTPLERDWHVAALALMQRYRALGTLKNHIVHARGRFPNDPRWPVEEAIVVDLFTWPEVHGSSEVVSRSDVVVAMLTKSNDAIKNSTAGSEAALRLAFFELRRGEIDAALRRFNAISKMDDPHLRYLQHLLRGRALANSKRHREAILEFQSALAEFPMAQSGVLGLASSLAADGRTDEATVLSVQLLTTKPAGFDPWTLYAVPDWRFWPDIIAALRKAALS